jgi:hypothetical protein
MFKLKWNVELSCERAYRILVMSELFEHDHIIMLVVVVVVVVEWHFLRSWVLVVTLGPNFLGHLHVGCFVS